MKKVIEGFSLLFLTCFSFYYTDKVINMVNKNDPLMIEIISVKESKSGQNCEIDAKTGSHSELN